MTEPNNANRNALATNDTQVICSVCSRDLPAGLGVVLRNCRHPFCFSCLKDALFNGVTDDIECPYPFRQFECKTKLEDDEVAYILEYDEVYDFDRWENGAENAGDLIIIDDDIARGGPDADEPEEASNIAGVPSVELNNIRDLTQQPEEIENAGNTIENSTLVGSYAEESEVARDMMHEQNVCEGVDSSQKNAEEDSEFDEFGLVPLFEIVQPLLPCLTDATNDTHVNVEKTIAVNSNSKGAIPKIPRKIMAEATTVEKLKSEVATHDAHAISTVDEFVGTSISTTAISEQPVPNPDEGLTGKYPNDTSNKTELPLNRQQHETPSKEISFPPAAQASDSTFQDDREQLATKANQVVPSHEQKNTEEYDFLLALSDTNLPPNLVPFECPICNDKFEAYAEVMLSLCFHMFCKQCLAQTVKYAEDVEIQCPALLDGTTKCNAILLDCEIHELLSCEEYNKYQEKCVQKAEAVIPNSVHCLKPNCPGWIEAEGNVEGFDCSVCLTRNCISCKAIHTGQSCNEYKSTLQRNEDEVLSERTLQTMENTREGMRCPTCGIMITKIAGCDFMTCTKCQTGICWPTRGPRWGPGGVGDNSGGCRCKVDNGRRCHQDCEGCH